MNQFVALPGIMPLSAPNAERQTFADLNGGWNYEFCVQPQGSPAPTPVFLERVNLDDQIIAKVAVSNDWVKTDPVNGYVHTILDIPASVRELRAYRGDTFFHLTWTLDGVERRTRIAIRQTRFIVPTPAPGC